MIKTIVNKDIPEVFVVFGIFIISLVDFLFEGKVEVVFVLLSEISSSVVKIPF